MVRVVCPDRERGTVCDRWGFTSRAMVTTVRSGTVAYIQGEPVPFTMRLSREWVRRGYRDGAGPRLVSDG